MCLSNRNRDIVTENATTNYKGKHNLVQLLCHI